MTEKPPAPQRPPGTLRLGAIAGSPVYVSLSWLGIAALIAVAVAPHVEEVRPGLGAWKYVVGVVVAVALYVAVLLHEASHVVVVKHFGHEVPSVTLSFMGGRTAVEGEARTPGEEALAAVVGPITSLAVGGLALLLLLVTPAGVVQVVVEALTVSNLGLGVLNLAPFIPLDGGRVLKAAVWKATGSPVQGILVAAWAGRVAAGLLVGYAVFVAPALGRSLSIFDLVLIGFVALFLWGAASAEISGARLRTRFATLVARDLARRTLAVPPDLPLAEAVRRAKEAEAGAIVTVDSRGTPVGLVHEGSLRALPAERRPWVPTSTVARTLNPALCLPREITGAELLQVVSREPATEYLLVESDGAIFGVLSLTDIDRAVGIT